MTPDHLTLTAVTATGKTLRDALDSAALTTISLDLKRLDTPSVQNCHPIYDLPSNFTLELIDLHTEYGTLIEAAAQSIVGTTRPRLDNQTPGSR